MYSIEGGGETRLNVAVTAAAADIVTAQPPEPEQAPDWPAKVEPEAGAAFRVTTVPTP